MQSPEYDNFYTLLVPPGLLVTFRGTYRADAPFDGLPIWAEAFIGADESKLDQLQQLLKSLPAYGSAQPPPELLEKITAVFAGSEVQWKNQMMQKYQTRTRAHNGSMFLYVSDSGNVCVFAGKEPNAQTGRVTIEGNPDEVSCLYYSIQCRDDVCK